MDSALLCMGAGEAKNQRGRNGEVRVVVLALITCGVAN